VSINTFGNISTKEFNQGQLISIDDGLVKIEFNGDRYFAAAPVNLILNRNEVNISEGTIYIEPANNLKLKVKDSELNLRNRDRYAYLSSNSSLLILKGKIALKGSNVEANNLITWEVDNFNTYRFNREDLTND